MSMNGVDYTKQLSKDREYYTDANRKLKDATEKRIAETEKRAEYVTSKQRENFIEDKAELENNYQTNLNLLKDKTQETLESSKGQSHNKLEQEREAFTQQSNAKSREFDKRLSAIKDSYGKTFNSEKNRNESMQKSMAEKHNKSLTSLKDNSEKTLQDYQARLANEGSSLQDQYNQEKQQLINKQEETLGNFYQDAAQKRADLRERIDTEIKRTKEVNEAEKDHDRQYANDQMGEMTRKFQDRYQKMNTDYTGKNESLRNSQREFEIRTNRENAEALTNVRKQYNDNMRKIDLDKRRSATGSDDFNEVVKRQQGLSDKTTYENEIDSVKNQMSDLQKTYELREKDNQVEFNDTLKEQSSEAVAFTGRKLNEANANKILTVSHEREKSEKEISSRENQNRIDKEAYESVLMSERNKAKDSLKTLKENFNKSMVTMEEKHKSSIEDVSKMSLKDKAEFMKRSEEIRSQEVFEMKRSFGKLMDATVQNYESRLANFQRDNEYLKMSMNQKIQNILDQTEKQLESQRNIFEDRRSADVKGQQVLLDQREKKLKKDFSDMSLLYQKKIDKMMVENETKLKLITNDYESKLKELKAMTSKEIASKDATHQVELNRLKEAYEAEKVRVVTSLESELEAVKAGHENQMAEMANYKRLT